MIDDEDVQGGGRGLEFEAELFLDGGKDADVFWLRIFIDSEFGCGL